MIIGNGNRKRVNQVRLPYFHEYRDRHGRLRRYFRRPGQPGIPLPDGDTSSPEFIEAYAAARRASSLGTEIGARRSIAGTVSATLAGYYASPFYINLAPGTRAGRRGILEKFRELEGDLPITKVTQLGIEKRLAKVPLSTARNHLVALRGLMQYAVKQKLIKEDPTAGIEAPRAPSKKDDDPDAEDGHATWPEEWIEQFEAHWPVGSKERLMEALPLHTAQRRSDVLRMGPGMVKNGVMTLRQHKTGTVVRIPLAPELAEIIAATACGDMVYLVTNRKGSYSGSALGTAFRVACEKAGLPPEATMHGLRKAWCRRAAEIGMSEDLMMSITGHKTSRQLRESYLQGIDQERLAHRAIEMMSRRAR